MGEKLGEAALSAVAGLALTLALQTTGQPTPPPDSYRASRPSEQLPSSGSALLEEGVATGETGRTSGSVRSTSGVHSGEGRDHAIPGEGGDRAPFGGSRDRAPSMQSPAVPEPAIKPPADRPARTDAEALPFRITVDGTTLSPTETETAVFAALHRRGWSGLHSKSGVVLTVSGDREALQSVYDLQIASVSLRWELSSPDNGILSRGAVADSRGRGTTADEAARAALRRAAEQLASEVVNARP
jgi:hypothetical protein